MISAQRLEPLGTPGRAEADLARIQTLADKQIVSQQQLDAARATVEALAAQLFATRRQAAAAGATAGNARAGIRRAAARAARQRPRSSSRTRASQRR